MPWELTDAAEKKVWFLSVPVERVTELVKINPVSKNSFGSKPVRAALFKSGPQLKVVVPPVLPRVPVP